MKILVIGTVRQAHDVIHSMGHEIVLFIKRSASKPVDFNYAYEKFFVFNNDALDEEYINIANAQHQLTPFDAVCAFNDDTQAIAVKVAVTLGLYHPVSLETLDIAYNKDKTRKELAKASLDDTAHCIVHNESALRDAIAMGVGKRIVKPASATGSLGISIIESASDIEDAIQWLKKCDAKYPILVEEFLEGEEFSVECFSENGQHFVLGITQKTKDPNNFVELGHTLPAELLESDINEIKNFIQDSLNALGIANGPTHSEIILTTNGPRLVETHTRVGGDRIFQLIELATGVNIFEYVIRQNLGEQVLENLKNAHKFSQVAAIRFLAIGYDEYTQLESIEKTGNWEQIKGLVEITPMKLAGAAMNHVTNSFDRTALAIATGANAEDAIQGAEAGLAAVEIILKRKIKR